MIDTTSTLQLAYLDPGTGAMILQVVLGGIAAGFVFFRDQFKRLWYFVTARGGATTDEGVTTEENETSE